MVKEVHFDVADYKKIAVEMNDELFQNGRTCTVVYQDDSGLIADVANNQLINGASIEVDSGFL